jgi:ribosome-interacting GTPase 1
MLERPNFVNNSVYIPAIFVLNKIDAISIEELDLLYKVNLIVNRPVVP